VLETYGGVHHGARWFMRQLALRAGSHHVAYSRRDVIYGVRGAVAIANQRGNARAIKACNVQAASLNAHYTHTNPTVHTQPSSVSSSQPLSTVSAKKPRAAARVMRARSVNSVAVTAVVLSVLPPSTSVNVSVPVSVSAAESKSNSVLSVSDSQNSVSVFSATDALRTVSATSSTSRDDSVSGEPSVLSQNSDVLSLSSIHSFGLSAFLSSQSLLYESTASPPAPPMTSDAVIASVQAEERSAQMMDAESEDGSNAVFDDNAVMSAVDRLDVNDDDERAEQSIDDVVDDRAVSHFDMDASMHAHLADLHGLHVDDDDDVDHRVHSR
jgi:hypothetical protein